MSENNGLTTGIVPVGKTRLILEPDERPVLTVRRETDARTALTRGIKEYLEQLSIAFAGRTIRFKQVLANWPDPEVDAIYPSATVFTEEDGRYDASSFTPILNADTAIPGTPSFAMSSCDFTQRVTIEAWTTENVERRAIASMLEDALMPVEWMYGCRLALPHYHGVHCTIEPMSSVYEEDDRDAQRRLRKMKFTLDCHLPLIRVFPSIPRAGDSRIQISLNVTVGPAEVPTGLPGPDGGPGFAPPTDCDC